MREYTFYALNRIFVRVLPFFRQYPHTRPWSEDHFLIACTPFSSQESCEEL